MASQLAVPKKSTCQFQKHNGQSCKRAVAPGEANCWQHTHSWKHKLKSLTRNQTVVFVLTALAFFIGIPAAWFTYDSWRIARKQTSSPATTPVRATGSAETHGDESPANTGDGSTFIYGNTSQQGKK